VTAIVLNVLLNRGRRDTEACETAPSLVSSASTETH
jgi:hypothetical protein